MAQIARAWVGTSGWNYKHWSNGVFYPEGLKARDWLEFFARRFDTVEINNTFYNLAKKSVFESWRDGTPPGFCFAVKVYRSITHRKKLLDVEETLAPFLENAAGLGDKLGPLLFQLPPRWHYNSERLKSLLEYMDWQRLVPDARWALEVRDESWYNQELFDLLCEHHVALVLADQPGFAAKGPVTADFVFVRRHGPKQLYSSNYSEELLQQDAQAIQEWLDQGRDVYIYFNNDAQGYAVRNAIRLKELLGEQ